MSAQGAWPLFQGKGILMSGRIYPTKQDAIQAAVDWVNWRDPESPLVGGTPTIWQPTPACESKQEQYLITHCNGLVGQISVTTSSNCRDGCVYATKEPSQGTSKFTWQDDGEYVRLRRIRKAKVRSARQAASAGPSQQIRLFGQRCVHVANQRIPSSRRYRGTKVE